MALLCAACGRDAAEQAYFDALEGEETGRPCEELMPLVDRAIALQPTRSWYWEKRSGYRSGVGDPKGALADIDKAIALADRPYLRYSRAILLCKSGRCRDALADLDSAIAAQPDNLQFYRVRAIARVRSGNAAGALEDGELLVSRQRHVAESFYARGIAFAALGRPREAAYDFSVVLKANPEMVYPLADRADAYAALGEAALAAADRAEFARRNVGDGGCLGCGYCADPLHH
jgi:tetratricopeptide (TPR) repeat protein